MRVTRYVVILVLTLAACFVMQLLALRAVGGRTTKSESNYFSSIGRIQAGASGSTRVMLLGSSITGRLPDRTQGFLGTANMGVDGGTAVDLLRAMDRGTVPTASHLVIEANMLQRALDPRPSEIGQAMQRPWFRVGLEAPALAAYARPAAFAYSKLLARRIGAPEAGDTGDLGVRSLPSPVVALAPLRLTPREADVIQEVDGILRRLRTKGTSAVLVWLPPARAGDPAPPGWILELARRAEVPFWDLGQEAAPDRVKLTDGIHMDAASAARTMRSLGKAMGS